MEPKYVIVLLILLITSCTSSTLAEISVSGPPAENPTRTITPKPSTTAMKTLTPFPTQNLTIAPTLEWWHEEREGGVKPGNTIVDAIEKYYHNTGIHPNTLNDLLPQYLIKLPQTSTGYGFAYNLYDDGTYILKFPYTRRNWTCGYFSEAKEWECSHLLSYP